LRVIAGAVLATEGKLFVRTRGRYMEIIPTDAGGSEVIDLGKVEPSGTRIEVFFGNALDIDSRINWIGLVKKVAGYHIQYKGKTSPHWYDDDTFYELCRAANGQTVWGLLSMFDGLASKKASKVAPAFDRRDAASLTREESAALLEVLRDHSKEVKPKRLGFIGRDVFPDFSYKKAEGTFLSYPTRGGEPGEIPFTVEGWATSLDVDKDQIFFLINRTIILGDNIDLYQRKGAEKVIRGCNLGYRFPATKHPIRVVMNITSPYIPLTSDGKAPDLDPFNEEIVNTLRKISKTAPRKIVNIQSPALSQRDAINECLDEAVKDASDGGRYRFSQRQLFYKVRPYVESVTDKELNWDWFVDVVTTIESERGQDIPGMFRDERGTLYHPHLKETFSLGTLMVEEYERPKWAFNKVVYIEKEGFFQLLRDEKWPEKNDCALLTSKGFATRAARDLLDLMGDTEEELQFFCIHDADAYGTMIYQTIQNETRARPGRKVKIINLGLEPQEALDMGLECENLKAVKKFKPVADYVSSEWRYWLQDHRVELDAMSSSQFLQWLDDKMAQYGIGKVVPPAAVLKDTLLEQLRNRLERVIIERILKDADIDGETDKLFKAITPPYDLMSIVRKGLEACLQDRWDAPLLDEIERIIQKTKDEELF